MERFEDTKRSVLSWKSRKVFQGGMVNNVRGFQEKEEHQKVLVGFISAELMSNRSKGLGEWWELMLGY